MRFWPTVVDRDLCAAPRCSCPMQKLIRIIKVCQCKCVYVYQYLSIFVCANVHMYVGATVGGLGVNAIRRTGEIFARAYDGGTGHTNVYEWGVCVCVCACVRACVCVSCVYLCVWGGRQ